MGLQKEIDRLARLEGFAQAGIAPLLDRDAARVDYVEQWVAEGRAGAMDYLARRDEHGRLLRASLEHAVPWARSVIVCAAPYGSTAGEQPLSIAPAAATSGWIARYAWSGARAEPNRPLRPTDYHKVLLRRLKRLEAALHSAWAEPFRSQAWVDTGPLIERGYAQAAGIGWTGKNTCTLSQTLGSFFFLGVIVTSLEVADEQRAQLPPDRCGSCTRCLDACPTNALTAPYQMDASRCIAYLTIEKRGSVPEELRAGIGRQIFGCDICQDVCPWNRKVPVAVDRELEARPELINPDLAMLAVMSEEEYARMFFGSPVKRARFEGMRRNLAIAMGNSALVEYRPQLEAWAAEVDPVLAESARWAIAQLEEAQTRSAESLGGRFGVAREPVKPTSENRDVGHPIRVLLPPVRQR